MEQVSKLPTKSKTTKPKKITNNPKPKTPTKNIINSPIDNTPLEYLRNLSKADSINLVKFDTTNINRAEENSVGKFVDVPAEILTKIICSFLSDKDLANCRLVSKFFNYVVMSYYSLSLKDNLENFYKESTVFWQSEEGKNIWSKIDLGLQKNYYPGISEKALKALPAALIGHFKAQQDKDPAIPPKFDIQFLSFLKIEFNNKNELCATKQLKKPTASTSSLDQDETKLLSILATYKNNLKNYRINEVADQQQTDHEWLTEWLTEYLKVANHHQFVFIESIKLAILIQDDDFFTQLFKSNTFLHNQRYIWKNQHIPLLSRDITGNKNTFYYFLQILQLCKRNNYDQNIIVDMLVYFHHYENKPYITSFNAYNFSWYLADSNHHLFPLVFHQSIMTHSDRYSYTKLCFFIEANEVLLKLFPEIINYTYLNEGKPTSVLSILLNDRTWVNDEYTLFPIESIKTKEAMNFWETVIQLFNKITMVRYEQETLLTYMINNDFSEKIFKVLLKHSPELIYINNEKGESPSNLAMELLQKNKLYSNAKKCLVLLEHVTNLLISNVRSPLLSNELSRSSQIKDLLIKLEEIKKIVSPDNKINDKNRKILIQLQMLTNNINTFKNSNKIGEIDLSRDELLKENEELKKQNQELKIKNQELKLQNEQLKSTLDSSSKMEQNITLNKKTNQTNNENIKVDFKNKPYSLTQTFITNEQSKKANNTMAEKNDRNRSNSF